MKKRAFRPMVGDQKLEERVVPANLAPFFWRGLLSGGIVNTGFGFTTQAGNNVVNAITQDWNKAVTGTAGGTNNLGQGTLVGGATGLLTSLATNYVNFFAAGNPAATAPDATTSINAIVNVLAQRLPQGLLSASVFAPGGRSGALFAQLTSPNTIYGQMLAQLRQVQTFINNAANAGTSAADLNTYFKGGAVPGQPAGTTNLFTLANVTAAANQSIQIAQTFVTPFNNFGFFGFGNRFFF